MRPAIPLICEFITEHRQEFGVAPIRRALSEASVPIAPRTYWAQVARAPSKRALWDTSITEILAGIYEPGPDGRRPPECLYGTVKMWAYLRRQGHPGGPQHRGPAQTSARVARCEQGEHTAHHRV